MVAVQDFAVPALSQKAREKQSDLAAVYQPDASPVIEAAQGVTDA